jgi:lysozyme
MKISEKGLKLIKEFESLHDGDLTQIGLQPKMCPAGVWTEGWGHAIIDPKTGKFLRGAENKERAYALATVKTEAEADAQLIRNMRTKFEPYVNKRVKIPLTQNQFDALVSHTYNTGGSDGLFRLVNNKASEALIRDWFEKRYITAAGVVQRGLIRRRKAEADLFLEG